MCRENDRRRLAHPVKRVPEWVGPLAIAAAIVFVCVGSLENFGIAVLAIVAGTVLLTIPIVLLGGLMHLWFWIEDRFSR